MAMLDYASKLTERPTDMIWKDVERLRDVGYTDRGILDINQNVSYFACVSRVADRLGVELDDFWKKDAWPITPNWFRS